VADRGRNLAAEAGAEDAGGNYPQARASAAAISSA
jgi:hypothetical protein